MKSRLLPIALMLLIAGSIALTAQLQSQVLDATGSTAPPPDAAVPRAGCVTSECHPGVKDKPFLHGPMQVNGCDGCHQLVDASTHRFEQVADRQHLCAICHDPEPMGTGFAHEPFTQGECLSCHDPHGSTVPQLLRGERYADSCTPCHEDMAGGHDSVHGPVAIGACGACHQPHVSELPKLLNAQGRDLCLRCHVRRGVELARDPIVHAPLEQDCGVCHDPHASSHPDMLRTEAQRLCTECHVDVAHTLSTASTQHAAVTTGRACLNCHRAHSSTHSALLRDESQSLCFECHNEAIPMPDGSTLINMKELIDTGTSLHGAISQESCVECHEIHGGGFERLLTNAYPSDLYYPFTESSYALCFGCHDSQLVLLEHTETATSFRNGDTNLHYVHVNQDKKGRSCRVCHDAHAASRDKHIRDEVPFGKAGWKLPIGFESIDGGGRCAAGCHAAYSYNRDVAVRNPTAEPNEAWRGEGLIPEPKPGPTNNTDRRKSP